MNTQEMKTFESLYQLKDLKAGEPITQRQIDAIEHLLGTTINKVRAMKPSSFTIHLDGEKPFTTGDVPEGMTMNGESLEHRP